MAEENTGSREKTKMPYQTLVITFIIGFVLGGGSVWMWTSFGELQEGDVLREITQDDSEESALQSDGSQNRVPLSGGTASVTSERVVVPDQEAGGRVVIQYVSFLEPGWVAIHELLPDGSLGNALGAQRFDAGDYSGAVSLLRVTEVDTTYAAVLYTDNGDRRFDLDLDVPVRDSSFNVVQTNFDIVP